jgi:uncharacterized protein DUF6416
MGDLITVVVADGIELRLSVVQAHLVRDQINQGLRERASAHMPAVPAGLVLGDDHPLWEQHSGLGGHRDHPEWNPETDRFLAETFYQRIAGKAKVFLDVLIDHPARPLSVDDIRAEAGEVFSGPRSIAGALNGLRLPHETSGRRYPFSWWEGRPTRYAMKERVAGLFRGARESAGPP